MDRQRSPDGATEGMSCRMNLEKQGVGGLSLRMVDEASEGSSESELD